MVYIFLACALIFGTWLVLLSGGVVWLAYRSSTVPDETGLRKLEVRVKSVEIEWENMYEALRKLAGRADKTQAGLPRQAISASADVVPLDRAAERKAILRGVQ